MDERPNLRLPGVHPKHIKIADARKGMVTPGDPKGDMTPDEHNLLNESGCSPFTSWTYSLEVARRFARWPAPGGVVLRTRKDGAISGDWEWVESSDFHDERAVLLRGVKIELEVMGDE